MTESSIPLIRPMTLGEQLDQAFRLYRRNFLSSLGIAALIYIPFSPITALLSYASTTAIANRVAPAGFLPIQYWLSVIGLMIVSLSQFIVVCTVLSRSIASNYAGQPIGVLDSFRQLGKAWPRLPGILAAYFLLVIAIIIWTLIPCVGWLTGVGAIIYLGLAFLPLLAPIIALEQKDALASFRRTWELARHRFWWLLGFSLLLSLLSWFIINGPVAIVSTVLNMFLEVQITSGEQAVWTVIIQSLIQVIGSILYLPLQAGAMTVVYFDIRVRFEGLDLALQAASDSISETNLLTLAEASPAPVSEIITKQDAVNFFLLTLAFIALYFLLIALFVGLFIFIGLAFT